MESYATIPVRTHPDAIQLSESESDHLSTLVDDFPDLFAKTRFDCGQIPDVQFRIQLKDELFVHSEPPRRLSAAAEKEVQRQVDAMIKQDFCEASRSPFAHGVLLRRKKDGQQRLCIDYRPLNTQTIDDRWPLPDIQELLHQVRGSFVFSALDMASAYNHISIHPRDRPKTAFVTRRGLYQLKVLSFGFKTAPPFFQRTLSHILRGVRNIVVYLDDILVFTKTIGEHFITLRQVFKRLTESNIKLKLPKCTLFHFRLEYLGHILSSEGIAPNPKYIEKCLRFPKPTTRKELQRFIGVLNWVSIYVPLLSLLLAPLTELLKSKYQTKPLLSSWASVHDVAFARCLKAIGEADFLRHPDPDRDFVIFCDASTYACGAVLLQPWADGEVAVKGRVLQQAKGRQGAEDRVRLKQKKKLRKTRSVFETAENEILWPVAFASHKFTETERRYHIVDLEIYAILLALRVWRVWLVGRHFVVYTDAKMAKYFLQSAQGEGRHARWQAQLMGYHMTLRSVRGEDNVPADWMSREQLWTSAQASDAFVVGDTVSPGLIEFELRPSLRMGADGSPIVNEKVEAYPVISRFPKERRPRRGSKKAKAWARAQRQKQLTEAKQADQKDDEKEETTEIAVGGGERVGPAYTGADRGAGSVNRGRALPEDVPSSAAPQAVARESATVPPSSLQPLPRPTAISESADGDRQPNDRRSKTLAPVDKERLAALRLQANLMGNLRDLDLFEDQRREDRKEDELSDDGDSERRTFAMLREQRDFTATFDETRIALEQESDPYIRAIRRALSGDDSDAYQLPAKYRERLKKKEFGMDKELVVLKPDRLLVPPYMRSEMLDYFHSSSMGGGHGGSASTYKAMRRALYWPGMRADVNIHVASCLECQKGKADWKVTRQGLRVQLAIDAPNEMVHIDTFELPETVRGNRYGMVMVDHFSGYLAVSTMHAMSGYEMSISFLSDWICLYGIPRRLHSDRGSEYLNEVSAKMADLCGFRLDFTSGWSPQANGKAENAVKFLKTALRVRSVDKPWEAALRTPKHSEWDRLLPFILMEKNTAIHPTHGYTPHEAFFGHQLRKPRMLARRISKEKARPKTPAEKAAGKRTVGDFILGIQQAYRRVNTAAKENFSAYRKRVQKHLDKGRKPHAFKVGDKALIKVEGLVGTERKLTPPYIGPFVVLAVGEGGTTVTLDGGRNAGRSIHVQKLRKWKDRVPLKERKVGRPRKKANRKKKSSETADE